MFPFDKCLLAQGGFQRRGGRPAFRWKQSNPQSISSSWRQAQLSKIKKEKEHNRENKPAWD